MSRIFEVVQSLSGQRNSITFPRPYLAFFSGDQQCYPLAAVLNQLVFWSGYSTQADGWFYKSHEQLGEEAGGLSEEQVRRLIKKITQKYLPNIVQVDIRKVNGTPTKHYRIDGEALISKIFPPELEASKARNGNGEVDESDGNGNGEDAESIRRKCGMETAKVRNHGNGEVAESFLYTDLDTDRDLHISCQADELPDELPDDDVDPVLRVLNHFNRVTDSEFRDGATTRGFISGVLQGEYVADDLMLVVDYIANEWAGQDNMSFYLRPKTIFSQENFEGYFDQARAWRRSGKPQKIAEPAKVNIDLQNQDYSGKPKGFRT
uniref:conserved phage C-terminal domain-containing protein n=1 Tax=Hafnia alvei TaxID=569 RepID=UPI0024331CF9|nr:conserved phage C-terminal domain-containing protein [Hafnia alvei]